MNINTNIKTEFLRDLDHILKKHGQKQSLEAKPLHGRFSEPKSAAPTPHIQGTGLPTAAESMLGLLTHLVDLEDRSRLAERRGELKHLAEVGQVIYEARKRQKLTVEALADLAGVGTVTIHKVEKGSMQVQAPKLIQIAEALGLELLVSSR